MSETEHTRVPALCCRKRGFLLALAEEAELLLRPRGTEEAVLRSLFFDSERFEAEMRLA
jgi:hypothetical protein